MGRDWQIYGNYDAGIEGSPIRQRCLLHKKRRAGGPAQMEVLAALLSDAGIFDLLILIDKHGGYHSAVRGRDIYGLVSGADRMD